jgi:hypothetical protein
MKPENNSHIPTEEILEDIAITQKEIEELQAEKNVFYKNSSKHRINIMITEKEIKERIDFVNNLKCVLESRNEKRA